MSALQILLNAAHSHQMSRTTYVNAILHNIKQEDQESFRQHMKTLLSAFEAVTDTSCEKLDRKKSRNMRIGALYELKQKAISKLYSPNALSLRLFMFNTTVFKPATGIKADGTAIEGVYFVGGDEIE